MIARPHNRNILVPTVGHERFNPMVVIRNMSTEDPVEMVRMLQQKLKEM